MERESSFSNSIWKADSVGKVTFVDQNIRLTEQKIRSMILFSQIMN